jgi:peroxygenase
MAGGRRWSVAASLQLTSVSALLLLSIFSSNWGHAVAKFDPANMTALQEHVSFFDRNKDGIITPAETFEGFVAIGCEIAFSTAAATTIHTALAFKTTPAGAPLPYINIYVENIHKAIHGGDTGVYDANGRFVPEEFEGIFKKYAKIRRDALTYAEMEFMLADNLDPLDPSSVAPQVEWGLIYTLASDWLGFLHKDKIRGIYDGSVFTTLAEKRKPFQSDM